MSCTRRCITQASRRLCQDRSSTNLKLVGSSLLEHVRSYSAVAAVEIDKSPAETWVPGAETVVDRLGSIHHLLATEFGASDIWLRRIEEAQKDLRVTRQPVLGVYGSQYAGASNLVTALIRDALVDEEQTRISVDNRHVDSNSEILRIQYGSLPKREADRLIAPSTWLYAHRLEINEVNASDVGRALNHLIPNDINLLVLDPIFLLSAPGISDIMRHLAPASNLVFVINGSLRPGDTEHTVRDKLFQELARYRNDGSADTWETSVAFVQADSAILALETLNTGMHSDSLSARTKAIETFQQHYEQSRMGLLRSLIVRSLDTKANIQLQTASNIGRLALAHVQTLTEYDRLVNQEALQSIDTLRTLANRGAANATHMSVVSKGIEGGIVEGGVQHSLATTRKGIEQLFAGRWSWLNLIGKARADEVGTELKAFIHNQFGRDLEHSLTFEAGQLSQLQKELSHETDLTLRKLAANRTSTHPLSSPILVNHLQTLTLSIPPFEPNTLTQPVTLRKEQLISQTVVRLQTSVQRILISTLSLASGGVGLAWVSYISPIYLISGSSAVGSGVLSVVAALAMGQRSWAKAQKGFWKEWERVTAMLQGDLKTALSEAIKTRLVIKPAAAADGIADIITRRQKRLRDLNQSVDDLRSRL